MPPHFEGLQMSYWVRSRSAVVNRFATHPERALRFLSFLKTPEYSRTVNQHYAYLPPSPEYMDLGVSDGYPELDEKAAHENSKRALEYGHQTRKSPFLMDLEVKREIDHQLDRLIANPSLEVGQALQDADRNLEALLRRNLRRDPHLADLYQTRVASREPAGTAD
jgi:ABC-type glycerol-3-phosphate transport system substrate-binding protein